MCNTDIEPNRFTVAQDAAIEFVDGLDDGAQRRSGHVQRIRRTGRAVDRRHRRDHLGDRVDHGRSRDGDRLGDPRRDRRHRRDQPRSCTDERRARRSRDWTTGRQPVPSADGDYQPDIIVVLTDGANTRGVDPVVAAAEGGRPWAAGVHDRIRLDRSAESVVLRRSSSAARSSKTVVRGGGGGRGGGGRGRNFLEIDEPTLPPSPTRPAASTSGLRTPTRWSTSSPSCPAGSTSRPRSSEITVWFALVAAVLAVLAMGLALAWNRIS